MKTISSIMRRMRYITRGKRFAISYLIISLYGLACAFAGLYVAYTPRYTFGAFLMIIFTGINFINAIVGLCESLGDKWQDRFDGWVEKWYN